ncbi:hypothetical protein ABZ678_26995 [Streptomyces hirsutus]|uniref:hypothetical protein n=1 Tax=Streptomyces hirsutus TaxID=35620 RepID=UPI0033CC5D1E
MLTKRGNDEAKKLLESKGIRVSVLREAKYHPITGELLATGYDDHAAAVTSTAAELHRAGIGHRLGFQTGIGHRLGNSYVQRADLVVRAPAAGGAGAAGDRPPHRGRARPGAQAAPVLGVRPAAATGRGQARRGPGPLPAGPIEHVDHEKRLWRRVYPPTGREGLVPLAFVFADTTAVKVTDTVAVLEEAGRRYWAPRRYRTIH